MAQFYATITGQAKTNATRRGSKNSGLTAHVRGWNLGVQVVCRHENGRDVFHVYRTNGSNDTSLVKQIVRLVGERGR